MMMATWRSRPLRNFHTGNRAPLLHRPKRPSRSTSCISMSQVAKGPPYKLSIERGASIDRSNSPWHVELAACFVLVLFAAFGNPASPFASGISPTTPSATVITNDFAAFGNPVSPFASGISPTTPGATIITSDESGVQRRLNARTALVRPARPIIPPTTLHEPFDFDAVSVVSGGLLSTWRGVQEAIRAESTVLARCRINAEQCPPVAKNFLAIIAEGRAHTGRARIGLINRAINLAIHPKSDPDHWMPPLDTLSTGSGDCKDYAIAKYVALMEAGIAEEDLRLVIVRDLALGQDHAIVATRLGQD